MNLRLARHSIKEYSRRREEPFSGTPGVRVNQNEPLDPQDKVGSTVAEELLKCQTPIAGCLRQSDAAFIREAIKREILISAGQVGSNSVS